MTTNKNSSGDRVLAVGYTVTAEDMVKTKLICTDNELQYNALLAHAYEQAMYRLVEDTNSPSHAMMSQITRHIIDSARRTMDINFEAEKVTGIDSPDPFECLKEEEAADALRSWFES